MEKLPSIKGIDTEETITMPKSVKKNTEKINLVLLKDIGYPFIYEENSNENLKQYIKKFINEFEK